MIMIYFSSSILSLVSVTISDASHLFEIFGLLTPFLALRAIAGCLLQAGGSGTDRNIFPGGLLSVEDAKQGLITTFHV